MQFMESTVLLHISQRVKGVGVSGAACHSSSVLIPPLHWPVTANSGGPF